MHSGSFYFCLQSFELFTQMKMKTKWNEDYSNIACLWGLRQFRKNSQCCSVVINSLEVATAFWCQSLCCCGQMWQDRTARCFPPANTLSSLMKRSWAAWRQLLMLRMWGSVTSSAATSKCHPKWCACSQGNLELKPADFLVLHALYCSPTFTPSPSPRTLFPIISSVVSCWVRIMWQLCAKILSATFETTADVNTLCREGERPQWDTNAKHNSISDRVGVKNGIFPSGESQHTSCEQAGEKTLARRLY